MSSNRKGLHQNEVIANRRPRLSALDSDPQAAAVVSKLVEGLQPQGRDNRGRKMITEPNQGLLEKISGGTARNVSDSESLYQLLPDIKLAEQILVSSILSPNDMVTTELNFALDGKELDSDLVGELLHTIREYFENTYKIKKLLREILTKALFTKGSYPMVILPESSIDSAINSNTRISQESISDVVGSDGEFLDMGILGEGIRGKTDKPKGPTVSFESAKVDNGAARVTEHKVGADDNLQVTDNPSILKLPMLNMRMATDRISDRMALNSLSLESYSPRNSGQQDGQVNEGMIERSFYKKRSFKHIPIVPIPTLDELGDKDTFGHPLVLTPPAEAVIPVHVPGNPEEHVGYFIMLDETGNPVNRAAQADYYADLSNRLQNDNEQVSNMISNTRRMMYGGGVDDVQQKQMDEAEIVRTYTEMVEADLTARLKNGVYGGEVEIARPTEVYRVMLARTMARMQTRVLYIPESLMTYIAFDYNNYGVGKSLLEDTKIIGSIRAMLLFSNTMAQIKNSVGRTDLVIELDPEDPDPGHTVEALVHEYARSRMRSYPIGESNPVEVVDYLQNAGVGVAVSGHAGYPETKMDVEDRSSDRSLVDMDLDEAMKKRHISAFGLAPETVDLSMDVDFATSVVASNVQLTKRVMLYQEILSGFLHEFIVKYTVNSGTLMNTMRKIVDNYLTAIKEEQEQEAREKQAGEEQGEQGQDETQQDEGESQQSEEQPQEEGGEEGEQSQEEPQGEQEAQEESPHEKLQREREERNRRREEERQQARREAHKRSLEQLQGRTIDEVIMNFLERLQITLPSPDTAKLENQLQAYQMYSEALDMALEAYINEDMLDMSLMGDLSDGVRPAQEALRAYFKRQWLRNNNVLPELEALVLHTDEDAEKFDLLDVNDAHVKSLSDSIQDFLVDALKRSHKYNKSVEEARTPPEEEEQQ